MIDVLLIHGAGYSKETWSAFTDALRELNNQYRINAIDLPGHGENRTEDMSIEGFVECVSKQIKGDIGNTIVIGHSLGGSVATFLPSAMSVILIDISEGAAMRSIGTLESALRMRPFSFHNLEEATKWYLSLNPHCLVPDKTVKGQLQLHPTTGEYTWRTDLLKQKDHWTSWFSGMDSRFLKCRNPVLIMSDRDYIDKELLLASMQGKFNLQVFSGCGHAIQEEEAVKLASFIDAHIQRLVRLQNHLFTRPM